MKRFLLDKKIYLWTLVYVFVTVLMHWRLHFDVIIGFYILGIAIGLHLLEIIETILKFSQSPFRTVLAQAIVTVMTLFVLTSSRFPLGKGVVLALNLRYLFLQFKELQINHNLDSWFAGINLNIKNQTYIYIVYSVFLFETLLFVII